jgi:hypothetical protein
MVSRQDVRRRSLDRVARRDAGHGIARREAADAVDHVATRLPFRWAVHIRPVAR